MEAKKKKCSSKEHEKDEANFYCQECKIYMCKKCDNHHSELFNEHHKINLDKKENEDIYTGLCKEKNHSMNLDYFCKNHNQL